MKCPCPLYGARAFSFIGINYSSVIKPFVFSKRFGNISYYCILFPGYIDQG